MHVLPRLRERCPQREVSELQRRTRPQAAKACRKAREISRLDGTHLQTGGLHECCVMSTSVDMSLTRIEIRPFTRSDYDAARPLWERSEGVGLSAADEQQAIFAFLERNPDMSFVAILEGKLIGTILCGHDGRRGLIHHLVTDSDHRRGGVGSELAIFSIATNNGTALVQG